MPKNLNGEEYMKKMKRGKSGLKKVLVCNGTFMSTMGVVRSLGRKGVYVIVADPSSLALCKYSKYCQKKVKCPDPENEPLFIKWLLLKAKKGEFDIFFPTSDLLMWYAYKFKRILNRYVELNIPSKESLKIALFKDLTYQACVSFGMDTPKSFFPESFEEVKRLSREISYPIIIKPRTHVLIVNDRKAIMANNIEELLSSYKLDRLKKTEDNPKNKKFRWPIIQEFIPDSFDKVYNVDGFSNSSFDVVSIIVNKKIRQRPTKVGVGVCVVNQSNPALALQTIDFQSISEKAISPAGISLYGNMTSSRNKGAKRFPTISCAPALGNPHKCRLPRFGQGMLPT